MAVSDTTSGAKLHVDFALAVQPVPPTMPQMIERSRHLPVTISTPAILLGVRATAATSDESIVGQDELDKLLIIMRPHLNILALRIEHGQQREHVGATFETEEERTLFCTYLKPGFVHVVAFAHGTPTESIQAQVVYSFPVSLEWCSTGDLHDRLRLVMALFTLQRHVGRISQQWNSEVWNVGEGQDLLTELREKELKHIHEVTNIVTPSPSDVGTSPKPYRQDPHDPQEDADVEDLSKSLEGDVKDGDLSKSLDGHVKDGDLSKSAKKDDDAGEDLNAPVDSDYDSAASQSNDSRMEYETFRRRRRLTRHYNAECQSGRYNDECMHISDVEWSLHALDRMEEWVQALREENFTD